MHVNLMKSMKHLNIMLNTTNNKIISFYLHTWMPGYNAAVNDFFSKDTIIICTSNKLTFIYIAKTRLNSYTYSTYAKSELRPVD